MKVPLLDLKLQYQSIKNEIASAVHEVMESQQFILGDRVEELERELARSCGTPHAVGVSSGSDALLLSLMAVGVEPGDRVVTTPYTFFATGGAISRLGGIPLFVDIDPQTYTIDPHKMHEACDTHLQRTHKTIRAIIPVHLYGQCADMEPVLQTARAHNIPVVEDAAQAIGATYTMGGRSLAACSLGDLGCLSFFPSKNLGCFGDGGMVLMHNEALAEKVRSLRMHGQSESYHHHYIGINGRLDALQAAVLLVKLPYLDGWIRKRQDNAAYYCTLFRQAGLEHAIMLPTVRQGSTHVFNQFVIRAQKRDALKEHLARRGVGSAIYYPLPLHLQECYRGLGYRAGDFPASEQAARDTIALPVFPELTKEQIAYVVEQVREFYER